MTGLRPPVRDQGHSEGGGVVVGGLLGVADHETDVVDPLDRERIVVDVVLDGVDEFVLDSTGHVWMIPAPRAVGNSGYHR